MECMAFVTPRVPRGHPLHQLIDVVGVGHVSKTIRRYGGALKRGHNSLVVAVLLRRV
jgi:hypothetical protein